MNAERAKVKELEAQLHAHHEWGKSGPTRLLAELAKVERYEKALRDIKEFKIRGDVSKETGMIDGFMEYRVIARQALE